MSRENYSGGGCSLMEVCACIAERLRARQPEIEQAILARARAIPDPGGDGDAEYLAGLRAAVMAVVDYGLTGIEQGESWSAPIPSVAIAQAHRAARNGVNMQTVMRRYVAGHTLLEDFVMQEAEDSGLLRHSSALRAVRGTQALLFDHLITSITAEYARELERAQRSPEQHRAEGIQRLLDGDLADPGHLGDYSLDAWHLGMIAVGAGGRETIRSLATALGCQVLPVSRGRETVWAWLGGQQRLVSTEIKRLLAGKGHAGVSLALGESERGFNGWRMTHRQAQMALSVALHRPQALTRYVDIAFLGPWLQDEAMTRSLVDLFLTPLDDCKRPGATLRETLRAYFKAHRNASAAASDLGVSRRTMRNRLEMIDEGLGSIFHTRQAELELVLRLDELLQARSGTVAAPR